MRFRALTKTLSPCAHMFFLVVWNMWRLVGSVETCPTQRRRVPITNILTTTPIRVYSMNHRLQQQQQQLHQPGLNGLMMLPIIPRYFTLSSFLAFVIFCQSVVFFSSVHSRLICTPFCTIKNLLICFQDCDHHWYLRASTLSRLIFE